MLHLGRGLKKRTRKAFGIRKKEKDNDSTGSPDREGGSQKKANGSENGYLGDIDWDRYNSPEVDDEGYSLRPEEESEEGNILSKPHFFSSDESEGEEDHRKKFKIKIKPLRAVQVTTAPSVDELKASIGNIALSPSPLRRSPGLKRNPSSEEIARPRRVVPTLPTLPTVAPTPAPAPQPPSRQQTPVSEDTTDLFGPPLDTTFGEQKTEAPPPLPPKNVPTSPVTTDPPSAEDAEASTEAGEKKPLTADLDNLFGPEQAAPAGEDTGDTWVCFSEESSKQTPQPKDPTPPLRSSPPPPEEPAPPLPASPPPPESPAPPLPASPPSPDVPAPPLPTSPPPKLDPVPPLPTSPSPSEEPAAPPVPSEPPRNTVTTPPKEDAGETVSSPKDATKGSRTTPPPPPPPTYRAVVSSPGPTSGAGGTNSGSSSPVRPATPSAVDPTPPPPPPRPPSRPKLPPGKPTVGDNRPFSPPVHSASPPPIAPLARAESSSSISSTNSLSAATTPTVGKELSVSVTEDDAYVDKLPTFERHFDSVAGIVTIPFRRRSEWPFLPRLLSLLRLTHVVQCGELPDTSALSLHHNAASECSCA
ncbi:unnamed protein product, partial [Pleuronectes platessa]